MKKRIVAFAYIIGVIVILACLFVVLETTTMHDGIAAPVFSSCLLNKLFPYGYQNYAEEIMVMLITLFALFLFFYYMVKWAWQANHSNRKAQHVKMLGSTMFLLWVIGWNLFIQAFLRYEEPDHYFVNSELLLRSAIAALDLFMLDIDSNILDQIKGAAELKGAISFVSILAFSCTIILLLSLVSERLLAFIRLKFTRVRKECPHVYVFFGLNEETEILAKDVKTNDPKSVRIVVEETGRDANDETGGWGHVVSLITHRRETFQKVRNMGARLSLTSVNLSEMDISQKDIFGEANLELVKKQIDRLSSFANCGARKLHLFFLSDNEEKNILSAAIIREDETIQKISSQGVRVAIYCHARYDSVNRVIEESTPLKNIEIRVIDSSRLSIELLKRKVENHPVKFVEIDGKENPGTVKSAFNSLVVGLGETGRDAVRFLYEFGAFMSNDSNNEVVRRSEFHCYVVDKDMERKKGLFTNSASEAVKAENVDGSKLVQFIGTDTGSTAFFDLLHQVAATLNYVVVAMGTDIENMTLAVRILKCLMADGNDLSKTRILVQVSNNAHVAHFRKIANHYNKAVKRPSCIEVFGDYQEIFSYALVVEDKFKEEAKLFYNRYQEMMQEKEPAMKSGSWEERRDELLGFCRRVVAEIPAAAAMLRYNEGKPVNEKLSPTGLYIAFEYVDKERLNYPRYKDLRKLRRQTEQDMSNAWHRLTKRELMEESIHQNLSFQDLYQKIQQLPAPKDDEEYRKKYECLDDKINLSKLILNLAITEHLRWNASHEMLGYKKGTQTDESLQRHNCLVSWKELDDVSCQARNNALQRVENGEICEYDFSKEIKKEHPHYKSPVKAYVLYLPDYKKYDFGVVETTIALLAKDEMENTTKSSL